MALLTSQVIALKPAIAGQRMPVGRPLHAAAAASLFLSLAALALATVSFWRPVYLPQTHFQNESQAYVCRNGYLGLFLTDRHPASPALPSRITLHHYILVATARARDASARLLAVYFWLWPLALLFGVPPVLRGRELLLARRARRRAASGLSTQCGYDLRASPTGCPECGRAGAAALAMGSSPKGLEL